MKRSFSCLANHLLLCTHIKRRREGKKRVKKQEQMSKILFNSQRQPISITVIYCCCYRFQWHTKSKYPLPKRLSFSFHIHMVNVSKAKLSNIEMRSKCFYSDVAIFFLSLSLFSSSHSLSFLSISIFHWIVVVLQEIPLHKPEMLIPLQNNNNIGYVQVETLTLFPFVSRIICVVALRFRYSSRLAVFNVLV